MIDCTKDQFGWILCNMFQKLIKEKIYNYINIFRKKKSGIFDFFPYSHYLASIIKKNIISTHIKL